MAGGQRNGRFGVAREEMSVACPLGGVEASECLCVAGPREKFQAGLASSVPP